MKPGLQNPHWAPPCTVQAICRACRLSGVPMPSMVVTRAPSSTRVILVMQARTTLPSRITEQQPHCPWPQPTLVPVSFSCSRRTSESIVSGSAMTVLGSPLMWSVFLIIDGLLPVCLPGEVMNEIDSLYLPNPQWGYVHLSQPEQNPPWPSPVNSARVRTSSARIRGTIRSKMLVRWYMTQPGRPMTGTVPM